MESLKWKGGPVRGDQVVQARSIWVQNMSDDNGKIMKVKCIYFLGAFSCHQAPLSTGFWGKNSRVGYKCPSGDFPTQRLNPCLLHRQEDCLPLSHLESPSRYRHSSKGSQILDLSHNLSICLPSLLQNQSPGVSPLLLYSSVLVTRRRIWNEVWVRLWR